MFCWIHGDMGPQPEPPHTCPICDGRRKLVLEGFFAIYHPDGRLYYTTTHPLTALQIQTEHTAGHHVRKIEPEEASD